MTGAGLVPATGAVAATSPQLAINASTGRHAISPYIYGMNFADSSTAAKIGLPVDRWGGNTTDTYNFKLGVDNTGQDYYYENIADCWSGVDNYCDGGNGPNTPLGYQAFINADRADHAATLLTLPMVGYVAKDVKLNHPFTCGFPATVFASQDSFDPYDTNCGNGLSNGADLPSTPTRDGVVNNPADNASQWINSLKAQYGTAANGGVRFYELGNEPGLWDSTHRDMHPAPTTYSELWAKSEQTAAAVHATDPSAQVLAFSEWGWPNYFCSAADDIDQGCSASSPDRHKHGGEALAPWLLKQAHAYDEAHGGQLFNYLDLHYYRQGGETTDVTRSLWDPTYTDPSWIDTQIDLIPRMQLWVKDADPGIGTSLSEYNLSIDSNQPDYAVLNALIQADTLGIFARQGLDLATRWPLDNDGPDINDAFMLFRNYDGNHDTFGNEYVTSKSSDQSAVSVYGALRSRDGALTIVVINKSGAAVASKVSIAGFTPSGSSTAHSYRWTGGAITAGAAAKITGGKFTASLPAHSMALYAIPGSATTPFEAHATRLAAPATAPAAAPAVPPAPATIAAPPAGVGSEDSSPLAPGPGTP